MLQRVSEVLKNGFIQGCATKLSHGARFFEPGSMVFPCSIRSCLWVLYYGIAGVLPVVYPITSFSLSLFPSQNVAINSKRERKEGNDKQKRKSHSEEIAVCKVFMNDLFPFHL